MGGCGCASDDMVKVLLFRQYETLNLLGVEIPFSLVGLIMITGILIQVLILSDLPFPSDLKYTRNKTSLLTRKHGELWYRLIILQLILIVVFIFYLLYLELFVIHFICILCTISKVIITVNTALILTWKPFTTPQVNKDVRME